MATGKRAQAVGYSNPRSLYPVIKTAREKLAKANNAAPAPPSAEDGGGDPATPSKSKAAGAGAGTPAKKGGALTPAKRGKRASEAQGGRKES